MWAKRGDRTGEKVLAGQRGGIARTTGLSQSANRYVKERKLAKRMYSGFLRSGGTVTCSFFGAKSRSGENPRG